MPDFCGLYAAFRLCLGLPRDGMRSGSKRKTYLWIRRSVVRVHPAVPNYKDKSVDCVRGLKPLTVTPGAELLCGQHRDGCIEHFGWRTDNLDLFAVAQFLSDRGFGEVGLPVQEACGRVSNPGWHAHDRRRIGAGAIADIRRYGGRADQDEGR